MARTLFAACLLYLLRASFVHAQTFEVWPGSGIPNRFGSHQVCEQHYYSCSLNNFQVYQEIGRVQGELAECLGGELPVGDCGGWGDGALWKPDSESRPGYPVFLLPVDYCQDGLSLISDVRIVSKTTGEQVASTSFRHCNRANGGRLHQNVNERTSVLAQQGPLLLLYTFMGQSECREVPDASQRFD